MIFYSDSISCLLFVKKDQSEGLIVCPRAHEKCLILVHQLPGLDPCMHAWNHKFKGLFGRKIPFEKTIMMSPPVAFRMN